MRGELTACNLGKAETHAGFTWKACIVLGTDAEFARMEGFIEHEVTPTKRGQQLKKKV